MVEGGVSIGARGDRIHAMAAVLFGLAFCWIWAGPYAIDPTSVGWLRSGDPAMHTLGWWFFRAAPWGWPPGASPDLGIELASSVALADALPLFAFPFKLLAPLLPPQFQYWGLWFLLCFALQAWFGYRLARALGIEPPLALIAALFAVAYPPFLNRISYHMALGGHWSILAALYLYVRPTSARWAWPLLLGTLAAVHGYLLAICGALWVASLVQRLWMRSASPLALLSEAAATFASVFAILYLTGTFMVGGLGGGGYSLYALNLVSFFDADGWSSIVPDLQTGYETRVFSGIGILILTAATLPAALKSARTVLARRWLPLAVAFILLTLYALSNVVMLGPYRIAFVPLPGPIQQAVEIFRSSGRMFWPVGYFGIFVVLLLLARRWPARAVLVASVLLVLQVADTAHRWSTFRPPGPAASAWTTPMTSPLWEGLAARFERLRALPVRPTNWNFRTLSYFALTHGLATDAVYLGRIDEKRFRAAREAGEQAAATGTFDPLAFYILEPGMAVKVWRHIEPDDLMTEVDGLTVFARGAADLARAAGIAPQTQPSLPPLTSNVVTPNYDTRGAGSFLLNGWALPEPFGTWSLGRFAEIGFHAPGMDGGTLRLNLQPLIPPNGAQQVSVSVNGEPVADWTFTTGGFQDLEIALPTPLDDDIVVTFEIARPIRPFDMGGSGDTRELGIALARFELVPPRSP